MSQPEYLLQIVEEGDCPLYKKGDEFSLKGSALIIPDEKPVCLILIKDITGWFERGKPPQTSDPLTCSGCGGRIRLRCRSDEAGAGPIPKRSEEETADLVRILKSLDMFGMLPENQIREITGCLRESIHHKDEIVIRKGDPGKNLYIIVIGRVEVIGDNDVSIAFLQPGEVFGEMSLLSGEPIAATIRAVEPAKVLYISGRDFRQILYRYPPLQMYFARLLTHRLASTNAARAQEISSGIVGRLNEMPPAEIFQALNTNQKTGVLQFELSSGAGTVAFREGEMVRARFGKREGVDAFYELLKKKEGRFKFLPRLSKEDLVAEPLGDFMFLLMEGVRQMDEE